MGINYWGGEVHLPLTRPSGCINNGHHHHHLGHGWWAAKLMITTSFFHTWGKRMRALRKRVKIKHRTDIIWMNEVRIWPLQRSKWKHVWNDNETGCEAHFTGGAGHTQWELKEKSAARGDNDHPATHLIISPENESKIVWGVKFPPRKRNWVPPKEGVNANEEQWTAIYARFFSFTYEHLWWGCGWPEESHWNPASICSVCVCGTRRLISHFLSPPKRPFFLLDDDNDAESQRRRRKGLNSVDSPRISSGDVWPADRQIGVSGIYRGGWEDARWMIQAYNGKWIGQQHQA